MNLSETIELNEYRTTSRKLYKLNRVSARRWLVFNHGPDSVEVREHKEDPILNVVQPHQVKVFHFNPVVKGKASKVTLSVTY